MTQHQEVGIMQNCLHAALAHFNMSQAQSCGYKYIQRISLLYLIGSQACPAELTSVSLLLSSGDREGEDARFI